MMAFDWQEVSLVVFDVDGTLYNQRCLRFKMIRQLLLHCLRHPGDVQVLQRISQYRRSREDLAEEETEGICDLQYERPAAELGSTPEQMRRTVEDWILQRPLGHLRRCRYAKVADFMTGLQAMGKIVAVLSDYPASDKLQALGLEADLVVSAADPEVDRLKPNPRGLLRILDLAGVESSRALLIGDRDDRDGECARRAGVGYLIKVANPTNLEHRFTHYADLVRSLHLGSAEDAALQ